MAGSDTKVLLTAREVGEALSLSVKSVYALSRPGGKLAPALVTFFGPRCLRFSREKVLELIGVNGEHGA